MQQHVRKSQLQPAHSPTLGGSTAVCDSCASADVQGHTEAWFHLGVMHLNGWGTARNLQQAQYFFSMAAKVCAN